MIYQELNVSPYFDGDFVTLNEVKKLLNCIIISPEIKQYADGGIYTEKVFNLKVAYFSDLDAQKYTVFDLLKIEGWTYHNTYWKNDHKVLTFTKE